MWKLKIGIPYDNRITWKTAVKTVCVHVHVRCLLLYIVDYLQIFTQNN